MKSRTASFIAPSPTEMNLGGLKITKKRNFLTLIGSELMHGVYGRRPVVGQGGRKEGGLPPAATASSLSPSTRHFLKVSRKN